MNLAGAQKPAAGSKRLYLLAAFFALWACGITVRLVALQIAQYGEYTQRAARQQQRTIEVAPKRGIIYDRNGQELAMTVQVESVFAVPSEIADPASASALLARILKVREQEIVTRLKSSKSFAWIARKVDAETSTRVRALNLKGIYFQKESKRFYPKRELAAQVLGYVGMDDEGLGGVERAFDEQLRGKPGRMLISVDAKRRWFGRVEREPEPGDNLVLTIDEKIQYIVERELDLIMAETRAEAATVVVQNPRTGEILALANRPTFNPNRFRTTDKNALKNRAVSDIYEPGSAFKVVTIAGALEEKLTTPEELIDCQNGSIHIASMRIRDAKPHGILTVEGVLAKSSNVGAIKLGLRLGEARFDRYIRAFGFGTPTGIEIPGETRGITRPVERWSKVSIGAISMGQEIGVSPLQLMSMVSVIANDGVYTPSRIVAGTSKPRSTPMTIEFKPAEQRRVVSPLTAAQMKKMMESVVLFGTGRKAILDGYTSAGKTGTAQKTDPANGAYHPWKHIASFAGFAPVNKPAVSIAVIIDSPVGLRQGGQVAAPAWARIAQQVLAYMHVPHDAEIRPAKQAVLRAAVKDEDLEETVMEAGSLGGGMELAQAAPPPAAPSAGRRAARGEFKPAGYAVPPGFTPAMPLKPVGAVPVYATQRRPPESDSPAATAVIDVQGGLVVPSFVGKPVRSAIETAQQAGIEIDVVGSGLARSQTPPPGARIPAGARVKVHFSR